MNKNLLRLISVMLFLIFNANHAIPQEVDVSTVKEYATNFIYSFSPYKSSALASDITPFQKSTTEGKETVYTYIINFEPEGWVLMSADERIEPVLAYSLEGSFDIDNTESLPFYFWFENYKNQIEEILNLEQFEKNTNWTQTKTQTKSNAVEPIIKVKWNQNRGWNSYCPEDESGPGGHAYAGCVAVAMAQNMSVFGHPARGHGSKTYISDYGPLTANFGETEYKWELTNPTSANEHIALILYHLGVSVSMQYDASGSGAYSRDVPAAIKTYFDYSNEAKLLSKNNYTDEKEWMGIIENELLKGRPLYYAGNGNNNQPGHAWNVDGMDGSGRFHFNWGWGGSYDGYYYLHTLNPGSSNFSHNQQAIINFKPRNHYPQDILLSDKTIKENLPPGTVVGSFTVIDETPGDEHTFEVSGPENIFGFTIAIPFDIEENKLITTEVLDQSKKDKYEIYVTTTDKTGYQYTKRFFIDVLENQTGEGNPTSIADISDVKDELFVWTSNDNVNFRLNNTYKGRFQVRLIDLSGKIIISDQFDKSSDDFTSTLNTFKQLSSGIYLLTIDLPAINERVSRKFIHNP